MKLLFDQNLSPRLVEAVTDVFPGSAHVQAQDLACATDECLWDFARENDYAIVTKDVDFSDRSSMLGHPPKVVWICIGNCITATIEAALRKHSLRIELFGADKEVGVFVIFRDARA